jgi:hypothetical protein
VFCIGNDGRDFPDQGELRGDSGFQDRMALLEDGHFEVE